MVTTNFKNRIFKTNTLIAYDVVAKKIRLQICITTKTINTHKKITNE